MTDDAENSVANSRTQRYFDIAKIYTQTAPVFSMAKDPIIKVMIEEKVLVQNFLNRKQRERLKKPDWLKIKLGDPRNQNAVLELIDGLNLHTVCQEAKCPNIFECWTDKTATFMLGGDTCTRHC